MLAPTTLKSMGAEAPTALILTGRLLIEKQVNFLITSLNSTIRFAFSYHKSANLLNKQITMPLTCKDQGFLFLKFKKKTLIDINSS